MSADFFFSRLFSCLFSLCCFVSRYVVMRSVAFCLLFGICSVAILCCCRYVSCGCAFRRYSWCCCFLAVGWHRCWCRFCCTIYSFRFTFAAYDLVVKFDVDIRIFVPAYFRESKAVELLKTFHLIVEELSDGLFAFLAVDVIGHLPRSTMWLPILGTISTLWSGSMLICST